MGTRWPQVGSRLVAGSGGFRSLEQMSTALEKSGTEIITVALWRLDPAATGSVMDVVERLGLFVLPEHGRLLHRP